VGPTDTGLNDSEMPSLLSSGEQCVVQACIRLVLFTARQEGYSVTGLNLKHRIKVPKQICCSRQMKTSINLWPTGFAVCPGLLRASREWRQSREEALAAALGVSAGASRCSEVVLVILLGKKLYNQVSFKIFQTLLCFESVYKTM